MFFTNPFLMFSFFKRKPPAELPAPEPQPPVPAPGQPAAGQPAPAAAGPALSAFGAARPGAAQPLPVDDAPTDTPERQRWFDKLRGGLRKTGSAITQVFTGVKIDEALYEELETALLMADTGVKATEHLLADLRRRVKEAKATEPSAVKALLADAIAELLAPLEQPLVVGRHAPTVMMVVGVNGAGKTTSIGKLTRYLADHRQKVLLAAAIPSARRPVSDWPCGPSAPMRAVAACPMPRRWSLSARPAATRPRSASMPWWPGAPGAATW